MLEKLVVILIILNVAIIMFAKFSLPFGDNRYNPARQKMPAPQYDINEFNAYFGYMMLHQFEDGGARFIINCVLPDGGAPIEMIMLSKSGVYVFEYVKAQGWISGTEGNEKWIQRIPMGNGRKPQETLFENPVMSAEDKMLRLRKQLKREGMVTRTIEVFPDFCILHNIKVLNPHTRIVPLNQLVPTVVNLNMRTGNHFTQREVNELYDYLIQFEVTEDEADNETEFEI